MVPEGKERLVGTSCRALVCSGESSAMRGASAEYRPGPDLRVLDGVAGWCGGLHGAMPLDNALRSLASGLDAEAAALARHHHRNEANPRTIALFDCEREIRRAYVQDVLGYLFSVARAGTAWFLSDLLDDPDWRDSIDLSTWRGRRGVTEIVVMPLAQSAQQSDYIEFHFSRALAKSERIEVEALVPTIVRSWGGRKPGLVTGAVANERLSQARHRALNMRPDWDTPLLGMSNPANLSRAEFRVCLLVSRGLSVRGMCKELGLSDSTVRTHLRAIYAKTGTSSMAELLYRVLSGGRDVAGEIQEKLANRG